MRNPHGQRFGDVRAQPVEPEAWATQLPVVCSTDGGSGEFVAGAARSATFNGDRFRRFSRGDDFGLGDVDAGLEAFEGAALLW